MIRLTPIDKTVAGQELIQMGIEKGFIDGIEKGILKGIEKGRIEGLKKGMDKGELIGEIRILQRILKYPQSSKTELARKNSKELRKMSAPIAGILPESGVRTDLSSAASFR